MPKFCQTDASEALSLHHEILAPQDEAVAQVLLAHHLVLRQLLGRALEEDFPLEQEVGAVGDAERLLHVVVGDEDADVLVLQFPDDLLDVLHGDGVDAGKGFVQHDELGVDGQAAGNLRAAPLAAGQLVALVLAHLLDAELGEQALQLLLAVVQGLAGHLEHGHDVVLHAHLAEDGSLLRQVADAGLGTLVDGILGNVQVVQEDAALVGRDKAHGHVERRGLARAVGAQQADNLPLLDVDGHVAHHRALAVLFHQILRAEHHSVVCFHKCVSFNEE